MSRRSCRLIMGVAALMVSGGGSAGALFHGLPFDAVQLLHYLPGNTHTSTTNVPSPARPQLDDLISKVAVVDHLGRAAGYERGCAKGLACVFGPAWNDPTDHSGCDTRNRILAAQLSDVEFKPDTHDCKVVAGWVVDPYTGQRITLQQVQIDHVVPLHRAFDSGASSWNLAHRQQFANDPRNLLAVSSHANESKGDAGPGQWLPVNATERCPYVVRYLSVAVDYQLPITRADKDAAVSACPA